MDIIGIFSGRSGFILSIPLSNICRISSRCALCLLLSNISLTICRWMDRTRSRGNSYSCRMDKFFPIFADVAMV